MSRKSAAVIPLYGWREEDSPKLAGIYEILSSYPISAEEYGFVMDLFSYLHNRLGNPGTALYLSFHYGRIMGKREERERRRSSAASRSRRFMDTLKSVSSDV